MVKHGGHLWHKHSGVRNGKELSIGERAADVLKAAFGTWTLLGFIAAGIAFWLLFIRDPGDLHLNLILSCMAAVQGVILQVAANRGDRISAEVALHTEANTSELVTLNRQQIEILRRLDGLDGKVADLAQSVAVVMAIRRDRDETVPGLSEVLAEVRAVRTLVEPAQPAPAQEPGSAGTAGPAPGQAAGMGSRVLPKRPRPGDRM